MNENLIHPASAEEALTISKRYPYFINPLISALPEADNEQRLIFCRRISTAVDSELALRKIFGLDSTDLQRFYPPLTPEAMTTDDTITSFIEKFGESEKSPATQEAPEPLVPVIPQAGDYAATLEDTLPAANVSDETSDVIDSFLGTMPPPKPRRRRREQPVEDKGKPTEIAETAEKTTVDSSALTESFAGIMIKNGNYEKALEIITQLSLNNPKKNIYFADQIRFLKKLILNKSKK